MYLCVDTITPVAGVTLLDSKQVLGHKSLDPKQASESLLTAIDALVDDPKALKAIFVIKGPGSFTGLRVGIATMNPFAHHLRIPIIGLTTAEWAAHSVQQADFIYLQTMNRDEIYIQGFGRFKDHYPQSIVSLSSVRSDESIDYVGFLSQDHQEKLPTNYQSLDELRSAGATWLHFIQHSTFLQQKTYDLVEPYYGKDASITVKK
ncbi:tRNA (adenosine(37)-N6)-threonylcarbamoyltransferase complex dimerization subunit type 1 TsaB [Candidatus Peregrinibacteria bacterium]|nr:MAG: tRNA (adenosine(37)-N6)-threonylcarbamoyltransferase complex dimerization subunit type 1 TsaB [Candidatus Peregrinibacteria bacterium]